MPQVKSKVDWFQNTHLALPAREPVRIDNSEVTIENDRMEEAKVQQLDSLHMAKHRALLDQQQEIKTAKNNVYKYRRVKNVIDPRKGLSCSLLVRRSKTFTAASMSLDESSSATNHESHEPPQRSCSWTNVPLPDNSTSWDPDFGRLPPVPFASQPVKMRHIPSVSSHLDGFSIRKGGVKISPNVLRRKRTQILNQKDSHVGRSYQTLKEISDVNKISESGKGALRERVIRERTHILSLYNDDLREKIKDFHKNMDKFIVENSATPYKFMEAQTLPKIY